MFVGSALGSDFSCWPRGSMAAWWFWTVILLLKPEQLLSQILVERTDSSVKSSHPGQHQNRPLTNAMAALGSCSPSYQATEHLETLSIYLWTASEHYGSAAWTPVLHSSADWRSCSGSPADQSGAVFDSRFPPVDQTNSNSCVSSHQFAATATSNSTFPWYWPLIQWCFAYLVDIALEVPISPSWYHDLYICDYCSILFHLQLSLAFFCSVLLIGCCFIIVCLRRSSLSRTVICTLEWCCSRFHLLRCCMFLGSGLDTSGGCRAFASWSGLCFLWCMGLVIPQWIGWCSMFRPFSNLRRRQASKSDRRVSLSVCLVHRYYFLHW